MQLGHLVRTTQHNRHQLTGAPNDLMISKTEDMTFLTKALSELSSYEYIEISVTSNRKLSHFLTSKMKPNAYQYPNSYEEFLKRQQDMHKEGIKAVQELVQEYLPSDFQSV